MKYLEKHELNLTPIFLMGNAVVLSLLLLVEIVNTVRIGAIASSKAPTLVELANGESIRVKTINGDDRSPEAIKYFVGQTLTKLFSWNALPKASNDFQLDDSKRLKIDSGVAAGDNKITTDVWIYGFALSEDFRKEFLQEVGSLTPPEVFTGNTQSILKVEFIGEPKKLKNNQWSINVVAKIIVFNNGAVLGTPIEFNKTVFVKTIDTPELPLISSEYQQQIHNVRKSGLEITKIQDINL